MMDFMALLAIVREKISVLLEESVLALFWEQVVFKLFSNCLTICFC